VRCTPRGCARRGISHCVRPRNFLEWRCRTGQCPHGAQNESGEVSRFFSERRSEAQGAACTDPLCIHPLECGIERRACRVPWHQLERAPIRKSRAEALSRHSRLDPLEMAQDAGAEPSPGVRAFSPPRTHPTTLGGIAPAGVGGLPGSPAEPRIFADPWGGVECSRDASAQREKLRG
jgi:hypothetical protein